MEVQSRLSTHSADSIRKHGDHTRLTIMTTAETGSQCDNGRIKVESPTDESPNLSDQLRMMSSSEMYFDPLVPYVSPGSDPLIARDSDLLSSIEETAFQALADVDSPLMKRPRFTICDGTTLEDIDFLSLTFPKKLWKIVESEVFKSISWDDDGNCVVIDEDLFKREVLERRGHLRIFETDSIKSFIRQLNLYGFSKMRQDIQRSASLTEFLAEEKDVNALTKLQFYYNPHFRREYPHLLRHLKRRVGIKNAAPAACSLESDLGSTSPKSRESPDAQKCALAGDCNLLPSDTPSTSSTEDIQKSLPKKRATNQRKLSIGKRLRSGLSAASTTLLRSPEHGAVDPASGVHQFAPFNSCQYSCYNRVNTHGVDSVITTSATSLYDVLPPVANNLFGHMMGLPGAQPMHPGLSAMQAHLASLLPFCNPWFSMPMIAAASAISLSSSSHYRMPPNHHCPNCNCSVSAAPSVKGAGKSAEGTGYPR